MSDISQTRIIIRHLRGSKTNQVEQIPLKDLHEITLGRDPSSTVAFDLRHDDVVSRQHAVIRVVGGDNPVFRISDLGSSNGTLLNGEVISGEVELSPEDVVELGKGGPKFSFDVQPRPANWASRTRVIDALDSTVTRAIASVSADAAGTREAVAFSDAKEVGSTTGTAPAKASVGKETVLRMLTQQRKSTSRVWMASLAAVFAVLCVAGVGLYRHSLAITTSEVAKQTQQMQEMQDNANRMVADKLGRSARDIDEKYGATVVLIELQWRLYDQATGKPVFQKVVKTKSGSYPAFVKDGDTMYRWLTLDDDNRQNLPIQEAGSGSGFVVGAQGFLLTNKHVAAGWLIPYSDLGESHGYQTGAVYTFGSKKMVVDTGIPLNSSVFENLRDWIPATPAPVFSDDNATYIGGLNDGKHTFMGRDEVLNVRFPGNRMSMQATLVRASTDADAALIKIDAAQSLKAVDLATSDQVQVGDRIIAMGYPAVSAQTKIQMETIQGSHVETVKEIIPEPTLSEGVVMRLGSHLHREGEATIYGTMDDAIQMSINSSGPGNSGGPVFNDKGHVIGLFTYSGRDRSGTTVTYAVPIRHGIDLMQPQRTSGD
ncbi:MAG TPA: trypsin-like peptidase domain-containing protein [Xanthobacteraceae bacterium]|nr:trypsin-like peptidase domain-containing protein [Xanthobacteraceae bacterium]